MEKTEMYVSIDIPKKLAKEKGLPIGILADKIYENTEKLIVKFNGSYYCFNKTEIMITEISEEKVEDNHDIWSDWAINHDNKVWEWF